MSNNYPTISVLIPIYNGAKYLKESIASLEAQTFQDFEVIFVSEYGSSDTTESKLAYYQTNSMLKITVIQNKTRLGLSESLNVGIKAATGKYIARVDIDDPSSPTRFEHQITFLEEHSEIFLCGSWQNSVTKDGSTLQKVPIDSEAIKAGLLFGCEIAHCSVMMRREVMIANNWWYNPDFLSEDYELWTRIIDQANFYNLPQPLVNHRWGFDNISLEKGEALYQEVIHTAQKTIEKHLHIDTSVYRQDIFSGWRKKPVILSKEDQADWLTQGQKLLQQMILANKTYNFCEEKSFLTVMWSRWNWMCEICGLDFNPDAIESDFPYVNAISTTSQVSVALPIYNSLKHLRESIDSVLLQDYEDWSILAVNEFGSDDGSAAVISAYGMFDNRIKLIQNKTKLGLGDSLNLCFVSTDSPFIARLDADDLASPTRFSKQVSFLKNHPDVGVVGTWQHHFGPETDLYHCPPEDPEECKTTLLFNCDLCHSTLMLRRDVFIENHLFYNNNFLAEDFELWTRTIAVTKIANIPEVLGEYRWDGENITASKKDKLCLESGHIVALSLKRFLNIEISVEQELLLCGWDSVYEQEKNKRKRSEMLQQLETILRLIYNTNQSVGFFDASYLLNTISSKWNWAKFNMDWKNSDHNVFTLDEVFDVNYHEVFSTRLKRFYKENPTFSKRIKKILYKVKKKFGKPFLNPIEIRIDGSKNELKSHIEDITWERYLRSARDMNNSTNEFKTIIENQNQNIDYKLWRNFLQLKTQTNYLTDLLYEQNKRCLLAEKDTLRVVFLFQIPSFWSSLIDFYDYCLTDSRISPLVVCYDVQIDDSVKTDNARQYLEDHNISYIHYLEFDLEEYQPHIVILQTPYDGNREPKYQSNFLKSRGCRVVYMSYGVEFSDTEQAITDHFKTDFYQNLWRLYTFSPIMKIDYNKYCINSSAVRALGTPRFDTLFHSSKTELTPEIIEKAGTRSICLWKVHFPKTIKQDNTKIMVTPDLEEYIEFANKIDSFEEVFFIFMPHPRFKEFQKNDILLTSQTDRLFQILKTKDNVFIDTADDYHPSLANSDFIIVDRSAIMIEAGSTGVPVLFMSNIGYFEPMNKATKDLVNSYYQGTSCADMEQFIKQCLKNEDPKHEERVQAWNKCIPFYDGKSSERIANDMITTIKKENFLSAQGIEYDEWLKTFDNRIWKAEQRIYNDINRHIDFTYRDIMIVLEKQLSFVNKDYLPELLTNYPIAYESLDHLVPHGTIRDNTRFPRFIRKCETVFPAKETLCFMDMGCSGGGLVLDGILRGHFSVGLEGSDTSLIMQRAEWRLLTKNLFTCDITKPFKIQDKRDCSPVFFDVISTWEVLEHIKEEDLNQLLQNIWDHLYSNGIFCASVADWPDIDPKTGVNWHVTMHPQSWWEELFSSFGFIIENDIFDVADMPRGAFNPPNVFYPNSTECSSFHIVVRKPEV